MKYVNPTPPPPENLSNFFKFFLVFVPPPLPQVRILPRPSVLVWSFFFFQNTFSDFRWANYTFLRKWRTNSCFLNQKQKLCEWQNFFIWNFCWNSENFGWDFSILLFLLQKISLLAEKYKVPAETSCVNQQNFLVTFVLTSFL